MPLVLLPSDAAADYDRFRAPGSPELYEMLREFGVGGPIRLLDVGVGTGLASEPLAAQGAAVAGVDPSAAMLARARLRLPGADLREGRAEALPFADGAFDAAIAADAFDQFDGPAAFAELLRVVRPGGAVAIWWRTISLDADVLGHRSAVTTRLGLAPVREPLGGGFRAFYAAPFADRALRIVPTLLETTVDGWIGFERTRAELHAAYGAGADGWLDALRARLIDAYGGPSARLRVRLLQYLYVGRR